MRCHRISFQKVCGSRPYVMKQLSAQKKTHGQYKGTEGGLS